VHFEPRFGPLGWCAVVIQAPQAIFLISWLVSGNADDQIISSVLTVLSAQTLKAAVLCDLNLDSPPPAAEMQCKLLRTVALSN
jgi:hypothetical protein